MWKSFFLRFKINKPSLEEVREEPINEELQARSSELNRKLGLLDEGERRRFRTELINILEFRSLSARYGAKDPIRLPCSDVLTIEERLYNQFYKKI